MYFKIFEAADGGYKDAAGKTYNLVGCNNAYTPKGKNEGWTQYADEAAAAVVFGITPSEQTPKADAI